MANGKAEITALNLNNISVNLTDYLSEIKPYDGFIQCNSPFIGGLLNNVYRRPLNLKEGHKLVRIHDGDLYTLFGSHLCKNYKEITEITPNWILKQKYEDPYVTETETTITITFNGQTAVIDKLFDYSYDYIIVKDENNSENDKMYFTSAPTYIASVSDFKANVKVKEFSSTGVTDVSTDKYLIVSQHKYPISNIPDSGVTYVQYDPSGIIVDTSSTIKVSYYKLDGSLVETTTSNVCHNTDGGFDYWTRGEKLKTPCDFNTLYYGKFISGISYGNSVLTYDVNRIIRVGDGFIVYEDPEEIKYKLSVAVDSYPQFEVDDDYIYFNTTDYLNTYSFTSESMICRSDDYNDRLLLCTPGSTSGMYASGWHSNAIEQNFKNLSAQYPQVSIATGTTYEMFLEDDLIYPSTSDGTSLNDMPRHPIEVFRWKVSGGAAYYVTSLRFTSKAVYETDQDTTLYGTSYAVSSTYNTLYNTPLLMSIYDTYINEKVGKGDKYSYILAKSQMKENILGYYEYTMSEIQDIFITQGSFYGVTDKFIFSITVEDSTLTINSVVVNKLDLEFIGAFPTYALFYSKLDKSLYSFTGDAKLTKIKECYRIDSINQIYCDPARLTMLIGTNIGTIVVYQDQTFLIEDLNPETEIFYDNNAYIVGDELLSLSYKDGYIVEPIKLQTAFYGVSQYVKSVNDCVYVRLYKNSVSKGSLKIKAYTLGGSVCESTNEKVYDLTENMFDKITGTCYIRYQPAHQDATGFSLSIESTNPIVDISIGHSVESMQNTKFNF